jgi:hypothetical protein
MGDFSVGIALVSGKGHTQCWCLNVIYSCRILLHAYLMFSCLGFTNMKSALKERISQLHAR